jgi:hypothetical protein
MGESSSEYGLEFVANRRCILIRGVGHLGSVICGWRPRARALWHADDLVGCVHMSGLTMRYLRSLALMKSADWIPIRVARTKRWTLRGLFRSVVHRSSSHHYTPTNVVGWSELLTHCLTTAGRNDPLPGSDPLPARAGAVPRRWPYRDTNSVARDAFDRAQPQEIALSPATMRPQVIICRVRYQRLRLLCGRDQSASLLR